jgi:hypothetical protein
MRLQKFQRRFRIRAAAGDLDTPARLEETREPLNGEPLVVDDVCTQHALLWVRLKADTAST